MVQLWTLRLVQCRTALGVHGLGRTGTARARRVIAGLRARDQHGAALVEAAIVMPLILLLTFGAIEFGIGFSQKAGIEAIARSVPARVRRRAATRTSRTMSQPR